MFLFLFRLRYRFAASLASFVDTLHDNLGRGLSHQLPDIINGDEGSQNEGNDGMGYHIQCCQYSDEDDVPGVDPQHVTQEVYGG